MTQQIADLSNELLVELTGDADFSIPKINLADPQFDIPYDPNSDLYKTVKHLTNDDLTTKDIDGSGTFDVLMGGVASQLQEEFSSERITGAEYTRAYVNCITAAMQSAIQFVTSKDQVFWQAQTAQYEAFKARLDAETARITLAASLYDMYNRKAQYALTKEQLATAKIDYDTSSFNLSNLLPLQEASATIKNKTDQTVLDDQIPIQTAILASQKTGQDLNNDSVKYNNENILTKQSAALDLENKTSQFNIDSVLPKQAASLDIQNQTAQYNLATYLPTQTAIAKDQDTLLQTQNSNAIIEGKVNSYQLSDVLPSQVNLTKEQITGVAIQNSSNQYTLDNILPSQWTLLKEQIETQLAQTKETRSTGEPVSGLLGSQIALYRQQIDAYKRDAESKGLKLMLDPWSVSKSSDEGVETPTSINNNAINVAATKYLSNLGLV